MYIYMFVVVILFSKEYMMIDFSVSLKYTYYITAVASSRTHTIYIYIYRERARETDGKKIQEHRPKDAEKLSIAHMPFQLT